MTGWKRLPQVISEDPCLRIGHFTCGKPLQHDVHRFVTNRGMAISFLPAEDARNGREGRNGRSTGHQGVPLHELRLGKRQGPGSLSKPYTSTSLPLGKLRCFLELETRKNTREGVPQQEEPCRLCASTAQLPASPGSLDRRTPAARKCPHCCRCPRASTAQLPASPGSLNQKSPGARKLLKGRPRRLRRCRCMGNCYK